MVQCDHHHFGSHRSFCQHLQLGGVDQKTQEFNVLQAVEGKYVHSSNVVEISLQFDQFFDKNSNFLQILRFSLVKTV